MGALRTLAVLGVIGVGTALTTNALAQEAPSAPQSVAFPDGARIAFVNLGRVAAISKKGQSLTKRIDDLSAARSSEIAAKAKQLETLKAKLDASVSVLNDAAVAQLRRQFERAQIDFQRSNQDAQDELQLLQRQLRDAFAAEVLPIVEKVAVERRLWAVFSELDAGALWKLSALDLSAEVAKRLDATAVAVPAKP